MKAYYLFRKSPIEQTLNDEILQHLNELSSIQQPEQYARAAYDLITTQYDSYRGKTLTRAHELWSRDLNSLWQRDGFLHCTNQNYLIALLLVHGKLFKTDDIKRRWTFIWFFSPHQYLRVRMPDGTWKNIDAWGRSYNVPFGKPAQGFNNSLRKKFVQDHSPQ